MDTGTGVVTRCSQNQFAPYGKKRAELRKKGGELPSLSLPVTTVHSSTQVCSAATVCQAVRVTPAV